VYESLIHKSSPNFATVIHGDVNGIVHNFGSSQVVGGNSLDPSHVTDGEESENDETQSSSKCSVLVERELWLAFEVGYRQISEKDKWLLASGRFVEDVLYENCCRMDQSTFADSLVRSFILDVSDRMVKGWFRQDEWQVIIDHVLPLPDSDKRLLDVLNRFDSVKSINDLSKLLGNGWNGWLPEGEGDERCPWIHQVLTSFLIHLKAPDSPLTRSHDEGWYRGHIWTPMIDFCVLDIANLTLRRTEVPSTAVAGRRNQNRQGESTRTRLGRRHDGIFSTIGHDPVEFGAIEDGARYGGMWSTKWLTDDSKLVKSLHDMLRRILERNKVTSVVQTVGFLTSELALQGVRLGYPGVGSVSLLWRENLLHAPTTVADLKDLIQIILMVVKFNDVLRKSLQSLNGRETDSRDRGGLLGAASP
jgi:hypothetical protein